MDENNFLPFFTITSVNSRIVTVELTDILRSLIEDERCKRFNIRKDIRTCINNIDTIIGLIKVEYHRVL